MKQSLSGQFVNSCFETLEAHNKKIQRIYPGEKSSRQPVQTVYGGAHLFKSNTVKKLGELALQGFNEYAKNPQDLKRGLNLKLNPMLLKEIHFRVREKLKTEAVEDFRIDFEDGFGNRPDAEEDQVAINASNEVVKAMKENTLPSFIGIRVKPLTEELKKRSIRTLDLFVTNLILQSKGKLPENFLITLPKITHEEQVVQFCKILEDLERKLNLEANSLKLEFMVETSQSILNEEGKCPLSSWVQIAGLRCFAAHFGTYDFTASNNITAENQRMDHPACDFARHTMRVALAGTGVFISDGATNIMPVPAHSGKKLNPKQKLENKKSIYFAWNLSFSHIRNSLTNGFYQGWDLHPMQLPIRYVALYVFFLEGLVQNSKRLKNFIEQAAKATLSGEVFDDAATGQGLLNYFVRAHACGAISLEKITDCGVTVEEIRGKSFVKILKNRRKI